MLFISKKNLELNSKLYYNIDIGVIKMNKYEQRFFDMIKKDIKDIEYSDGDFPRPFLNAVNLVGHSIELLANFAENEAEEIEEEEISVSKYKKMLIKMLEEKI